MKFSLLKNGLFCLVAIFSLLLIVAAIQFVLWDVVSVFVKQSLMLVLLLSLILAAHFWTASHEHSSGLQKLMMNLLYVEIIASAVVSAVMIYGNFNFYKILVLLSALQFIHLAVYLSYMFLYDEKPIQQVSLSDEEILEKSRKRAIDPSIQE